MMGGELERLVVELAELSRQRFYGKYRAVVADVDDEEKLGRIRAYVPDVYGEDVMSPWALPCVPLAGASHGLVCLPEADDGVWIEFEAGDRNRPVWTGCWWGKDDLADDLGAPLARSFVTTAGHRVTLDDDGNTITIEHADGAKVELTDSSMTLECKSGTVVLDSSGVNINDGALTVK
ncbi:MAG TPA: phage baseplate assembly protein V [Burkholderiales bacterium]|nr:phage baseplate assembly protein V [Burkholderiales bacterium]